jgi:hypothetical protein
LGTQISLFGPGLQVGNIIALDHLNQLSIPYNHQLAQIGLGNLGNYLKLTCIRRDRFQFLKSLNSSCIITITGLGGSATYS